MSCPVFPHTLLWAFLSFLPCLLQGWDIWLKNTIFFFFIPNLIYDFNHFCFCHFLFLKRNNKWQKILSKTDLSFSHPFSELTWIYIPNNCLTRWRPWVGWRNLKSILSSELLLYSSLSLANMFTNGGKVDLYLFCLIIKIIRKLLFIFTQIIFV